MSDVKWIKISTGIFDDEKIKLIESMPDSDTILIIWIKLLALAGRQNERGEIFIADNLPYTDQTLATIFGRKVNTVKLAMTTFEKFGMIQILEGQRIAITNWDKHQSADGLDKIRENGRDRQRRLREKRAVALLPDKEEDKSREEGNVTVSRSVTLHNSGSKSRPSSVEEVEEFCKSLGLLRSDGEFFFHKWEASGHMVNKSPIKDWRAVVRQWKSTGYCPSQKDAAKSSKPKSCL